MLVENSPESHKPVEALRALREVERWEGSRTAHWGRQGRSSRQEKAIPRAEARRMTERWPGPRARESRRLERSSS